MLDDLDVGSQILKGGCSRVQSELSQDSASGVLSLAGNSRFRNSFTLEAQKTVKSNQSPYLVYCTGQYA